MLFLIFTASFVAGYFFSRPGEKDSYPIVWKMGVPLFVIGSVAEFANMAYIGEIPLLVPEMRTRLIPALSYISFLVVPACLITISSALMRGEKKEAFLWFTAGIFLMSLLGYRTEVFVLMLGTAFCAYYTLYTGGRSPGTRRLVKYAIPLALFIVLLNTGVAYFRQTPLSESMDRFAFTTQIFSSMADSMGLSVFGTGHGLIHQSILSSVRIIPGSQTGPRTFISQFFGITGGSTTPTIAGIPFVDFGIAGLLAMGLILGLLFGRGYKSLRVWGKGSSDLLPIHALCMAFLIITIETGIADVIVVVYLIAYLLAVV